MRMSRIDSTSTRRTSNNGRPVAAGKTFSRFYYYYYLYGRVTAEWGNKENTSMSVDRENRKNKGRIFNVCGVLLLFDFMLDT